MAEAGLQSVMAGDGEAAADAVQVPDVYTDESASKNGAGTTSSSAAEKTATGDRTSVPAISKKTPAKTADADTSAAEQSEGDAQDESLASSPSSVSVATASFAATTLSPALLTSNSVLNATPMVLPVAAAVPVVPAPDADATPTGLIVGNGGVVGTTTQLLGTTGNSLFLNSDGYVRNGGLSVINSNFTQGYSVVDVLGVPTLELAPVGTVLNTADGTVLGGTGTNSHLTLIGAVTSQSYIDNINNGSGSNGLLGIVLPTGAPAYASTCLNVLGAVTAQCYAINAAQDYQVLVGDGASANGSKEVVIGTNATHTLSTVDADVAFPGDGTNDPTNPTGVPTADYAARQGHSVVIGDDATGTANAQTILGAEATSSVANSVALGYQSAADRGALANYTAYGLTALQNSVGEVSIGTPGNERQITNVAAGQADTDAVNVSQLRGVAAVADNAVQYDDNTFTHVTLSGPVSSDGGVTGGTTISNVHQGDLNATSTDAVNGSQLWHWTQDTGNIYSNYSLYNDIQNLPAGGAGIKYFHANSTLADSQATGSNSVAVGPAAKSSGDNSVALGNGATSTADNSVAIGANSVADRADTVSVGSAGSERQITNVAAGSEATDAVNVGQLDASVTAVQQGSVRYDTNSDGSIDYNNITLGNGGAGNSTIHNVAAGTADTDAVNVGQLNDTVQQGVNWANAYTDQQVRRISDHANAGVAAAMAMAGLPQAYEPGKSMAALAGSSFRGESSIAIGLSTISEGGRWVYKLTGSTDSRGDGGVSVGAGMQW